ncbi:hypothetical protein Dimus_009352 [Dionaea muscipula]
MRSSWSSSSPPPLPSHSIPCDTVICGNESSSSKEDRGVADGGSPDSRSPTNVVVAGSVSPDSRSPPGVGTVGGSPGSSDSGDDSNVRVPESSLRQRILKTLSRTVFGSGSSSSTSTRIIFTPTPTTCSSISSPTSSVSRRLGPSPLGRSPAQEVDDDVSSAATVQNLDLCDDDDDISSTAAVQSLDLGDLDDDLDDDDDDVSSTAAVQSLDLGRSSSPGLAGLFHRSKGVGFQGIGGTKRPGHGPSVGRSSTSAAGNIPNAGSVAPQKVVLPYGTVFRKGIPKGSLTRDPPRKDVMGTGKGTYGYGSVMWSSRKEGGLPGGKGAGNPTTWMEAGLAEYLKGNFSDALRLYDRGIEMLPGNPEYRCDRAVLLQTMGRVWDAVNNCEVALVLDENSVRAHHILGNLVTKLGHVEVARKHFGFPGVIPSDEELQRLEAVETHLQRCGDARKKGDWIKALEETEATLAAGAYYSPQLLACRAECRLKLLQIDDANSIIAQMGIDTPPPVAHSCSNTRFFGMLSEAYPLYVKAQIDLAYGRFADASFTAKKALRFEPNNGTDLTALVNKVETVTRARSRGNELVESNRLTEACAAYDEGLAVEPFNAILHSNKAACSYMLNKWEQCVDDCSNALRTRPNYAKALQRRAFSYLQLEKWAQAIQDYEVLIQQCPDSQEYKEGLTKANLAWMKSQEGLVQEIVSLEQFRNVTSAKGVFVVHFFEKSESDNSPCRLVSSIMDVLKNMYPAITFLKVDVKQSSQISNVENVYTVSTIKIYKDGNSVKEVLNPTLDVLGNFMRYYSKDHKA